MKRLLATFHVLSLTMLVFALTMLIPLGVAFFGGDAGLNGGIFGCCGHHGFFRLIAIRHTTLPRVNWLCAS